MDEQDVVLPGPDWKHAVTLSGLAHMRHVTRIQPRVPLAYTAL